MSTDTSASSATTADAASTLKESILAGLGSLTWEKVLSALVLLVFCLVVIRLVMALTRRLTARIEMDQRMKKYLLGAVRVLLYIVAGLIVAGSLGIDVTSLIALVSVFGLAVSLAVQDVLSNVAGGMVILFSKPFSLGDYVAIDSSEGEVAEISLTHTKLDDYQGRRIMLPNSVLMDGTIVNYTVRGVRRVDHTISASYGDSTEAVRAACLRAVERTEGVLEDPAPQAVLSAYGESAIEYKVRFWTRTADYWDAHCASLAELRSCFEEDGLTITYQHLNIHIVETPENNREKSR